MIYDYFNQNIYINITFFYKNVKRNIGNPLFIWTNQTESIILFQYYVATVAQKGVL